ncbi:hypothetical protein CQW23_00510 [Capsicum baccatum]|uniref:Uncharacterized protein n=1 Tax=Capsicum baccatum TaxID=33114 RepID=A0A2G2XKZ4_CAPBA|nr:hypothetical protein CQW23_00510 [Capsicum baccatum]
MEESGAFFDNRPNFMHIDSASAPTAAPSVPTSTAAPSVATSTAAPLSAAAASVASRSAAAPSVIASSAAAVDDIDVGPAGSDFSEEEIEGSDYSTEDSVESERELVGDDDDEKYGSDVHKEVRELRYEKRKFQRRKRKERVPANNAEKTPTEATNAAPQGKNDGSGRGRGRPKKTSSEAITKPPQAKKERGRPKRTISVGATATPLPTAPPVPTIFPASFFAPPDFCTSSSIAETTKRGMGSGRGNTAPFKRQRVVGMDVFLAENGFKPGMPNSKIYSTGQAKVARSTDVTGDIGYTPSSTCKLNGMANQQSQQENYKNLKRIEERRKWEVVQIIQVKIPLLHSPTCHENCSAIDVF